MGIMKFVLFGALAFVNVSLVHASDKFTSLTHAFPLLAGLKSPPSKLSPRYGGQNFTMCCLKAFDQALKVEDGYVVPGAHPEFLSENDKPVDIDNLLGSQFPCGATYDGNRKGVNQLKVPWNWCHGNCPGFELSESKKLNQWIQPFVGFILPSVIFCLTVPRRRKLRLPTWVFPPKIRTIEIPYALFCAAAAAIMVSIDTIIWLGTVFALSGPLLLSGLYEAFIDKRIVDYMFDKIKNEKLPLSLRARILITVLVGNLDSSSAWGPSMALANCLDRSPSIVVEPPSNTTGDTTPVNNATSTTARGKDIELQRWPDASIRSNLNDVKVRLKSMLACQNSFGSYVGAPVIFYIGSFIFTLLEINATLGDNETANALAFGMWWMSLPHVSIVSGCLLAGNNPNTLEAIAPNGGASVQGTCNQHASNNAITHDNEPNATAPHVQGDNVTSNDARGRGVPSAGESNESNEPNTPGDIIPLDAPGTSPPDINRNFNNRTSIGGPSNNADPQMDAQSNAVTSHEASNDGGRAPSPTPITPNYRMLSFRLQQRVAKRLLESTYQAQYSPAPMWERGRSKREWAFSLAEEYDGVAHMDMLDLRERISLTWREWIYLTAFAIMLFGVPCLLGMLTAYYTPQVGLACRSLTFLVYACSQVLLLCLWIWNLTWGDKAWRRRRQGDTSRREGTAHTTEAEDVHAEDVEAQGAPMEPHSTTSDVAPARRTTFTSYAGTILFWSLMGIALTSAVFSAIGGTMMQIIGVYRNCLCKISVRHWLDKDMTLFLSSNNQIDIKEATEWWRTTGAVATGFLGVICYIGWWYQRRLRYRFGLLVEQLGDKLPDILPSG